MTVAPDFWTLNPPPLTQIIQLNPEARQALPKLAFTGFASRFKEPKPQEGFQDVVTVDFKFRGTKEEYDIWGRYWL
jgi:bifunctional polynucleotide phosphatase/kinase